VIHIYKKCYEDRQQARMAASGDNTKATLIQLRALSDEMGRPRHSLLKWLTESDEHQEREAA
jgi:hypothetical protein